MCGRRARRRLGPRRRRRVVSPRPGRVCGARDRAESQNIPNRGTNVEFSGRQSRSRRRSRVRLRQGCRQTRRSARWRLGAACSRAFFAGRGRARSVGELHFCAMFWKFLRLGCRFLVERGTRRIRWCAKVSRRRGGPAGCESGANSNGVATAMADGAAARRRRGRDDFVVLRRARRRVWRGLQARRGVRRNRNRPRRGHVSQISARRSRPPASAPAVVEGAAPLERPSAECLQARCGFGRRSEKPASRAESSSSCGSVPYWLCAASGVGGATATRAAGAVPGGRA